MSSAASRTRTPGSSPRVRGKQGAATFVHVHPRLIPARAGKTARTAVRRGEYPAHPRACGENPLLPRPELSCHGSSPRVRGKPGPPMVGGVVRGLIPARAGKTTSSSTRRRVSTAHPRACGENRNASTQPAMIFGSSPRVRGKPGGAPAGGSAPGLIPARAGKTCASPRSSRTPTAHPRACGEN